MQITIPISDFTKLVDGELTLKQLVSKTQNTIDDAVLLGAQTALSALAANRNYVNLAFAWLKLPVTFASGGQATSAADMPKELAELDTDGFASLKALLLEVGA